MGGTLKALEGQEFDVVIEKMAPGGAGIARLSTGVVAFVVGGAPGDFLKVKVKRAQKRFLECQIVEILKPSLFRQPPPCPYFGVCGGCNWQHIPYSEQLKQKQNIVKEAISRKGITKAKGFQFLEIEPSPKEFRYRNRIQLQVGRGCVGFFASKSHNLVPIQDCLLVDEKIGPLQDFANKFEFGQRIEVGLDDSGHLFSGRTSYGGIQFTQVNPYQNENLVNILSIWVKERIPADYILDLYCGSGNLTFPLARALGACVIGVESNKFAIEKALQQVSKEKQKNPAQNQNIEFVAADVGEWLKSAKSYSNAVVVLDPPRVGCSDLTVRGIAQIRPKVIFYVSCDIQTMVRDMEKLTEYELVRIKPLDMFPQTDHIETISEWTFKY